MVPAVGAFGWGDARRILDLYVYRCSESQYFAEQKAALNAVEDAFRREDLARSEAARRQFPPVPASTIKALKERRSDRYGGAWLFNEAVGLISLCAARAKIGALFYYVNGRVMKGMVRKRVFLRGKLFEFNTLFPEPRTSGEIHEKLRQELRDSIADASLFKDRVIDFEPLDNLGPHIDWVAVTS
jgi:hypothetical protein